MASDGEGEEGAEDCVVEIAVRVVVELVVLGRLDGDGC